MLLEMVRKSITLECPPSMQPHVEKVIRGEYDLPVIFDQPPVVLDVGANVGAFSLWALSRWPGCKIHAYEPLEFNLGMLKRNLAGRENVEIHPVAVADGPEFQPLYRGPSNCGENSLILHPWLDRKNSEMVKVVCGATLPQANVLKVDTEGSELPIIFSYLRRKLLPVAIMLEWHSLSDRYQIGSRLVEYGYELHDDVRTHLDGGIQKWILPSNFYVGAAPK